MQESLAIYSIIVPEFWEATKIILHADLRGDMVPIDLKDNGLGVRVDVKICIVRAKDWLPFYYRPPKV